MCRFLTASAPFCRSRRTCSGLGSHLNKSCCPLLANNKRFRAIEARASRWPDKVHKDLGSPHVSDFYFKGRMVCCQYHNVAGFDDFSNGSGKNLGKAGELALHKSPVGAKQLLWLDTGIADLDVQLV